MSTTATPTPESIRAEAAKITIGDRTATWQLWHKLVNAISCTDPHDQAIWMDVASVSSTSTFAIKESKETNLKQTIRCLLQRAPIGADTSVECSLLATAVAFTGHEPFQRFTKVPDILLDLHDEDPLTFPLVIDGSNFDRLTPFAMAVRHLPLFAIRLAPRVNDHNFLERPLPLWPLMACIVDDIYCHEGGGSIQNELIDLIHHLLQPCYDFRLPLIGSIAEHAKYGSASDVIQYRTKNTAVSSEAQSKVDQITVLLQLAVERRKFYSEHFTTFVIKALDQSLPTVLFPLVLQFAALPDFI